MNQTLGVIRWEEAVHAARLRGASDLHLCTGSPPMLRTAGILETSLGPALSGGETEAMVRLLLDDSAFERAMSRGDATVTIETANDGRVRVHAFRSRGSWTLAARFLQAAAPRLDDLGLPSIVKTFASFERGLVLFAGPTGSGKTTALAALVQEINQERNVRLLTIEDPVEYLYGPGKCVISQREIGKDARSYAQAVVAALRSDPDVIVLGEMRDPKTMRAALTAAETGHLVLSSIHTADAAQTVDRIANSFDGVTQSQVRVQLAQSLRAIVCMRLVQGRGGARRHNASEVLVVNDAARTMIREAKTHQLRNLLATHRNDGMQTLERHLCELVASGAVTLDAARSVSVHPGEVDELGDSAA